MNKRSNADAIRAMTDDELAEQLVIEVYGLAPAKLYLSAPTGRILVSRQVAVQITLQWLQEECEDA